ncbi:MAG: hypothetical protein SCH98_18910 [Deferrisomatales bacterium]|nr:hypothetical protein [Deferrisomatales bacterium]
MWENLREAVASVDWRGLLENVSNERLVAFFTHPYGLAGLGLVLLLSLILKWRVTFVVISAALAVAFLARSTLSGVQDGPNRNVLFLAAGGVAVGAFVIYYLFIRED